MKILVILGGTLTSSEKLAIAYKEVTPKLLQQGLEGKGTPFINHEIITVFEEDAINTFFEQRPERLIFLGTFVSNSAITPKFMLLQRMITREMDKRKFLFANPIRIPPFGDSENFFAVTETDKMAAWLEI